MTMDRKRTPLDEEIGELRTLLDRRKYRLQEERRRHLRAQGRIIEVPGLQPPPGIGLPRLPSGLRGERLPARIAGVVKESAPGQRRSLARRLAENALLVGELAIIALLLYTALSVWQTNNSLNRALAERQQSEGVALALPTPRATPVIDVVVLPGGHRYPQGGETPQPGEAGFIPAHLLPAIAEYVPPPAPTPAPEHARRVQIAAIGVDSAIYQGMYDWEVLKKGVAQHIGSAAPGTRGNMVFAGHNDVYGEVFRDLEQLAPGDEIVVSSERLAYTYVVRETVIVDPAEVWVMAPTDYPSLTLISCYPYRVNTKRIVVFADLAS
jgi:sortase A